MSVLHPLAIIAAAVLWSVDGLLRQSLYAVPTLTIVTLEHVFGAILFLPFLYVARREFASMKSIDWLAIFWVSLFGGILGTYCYTLALGYVGYIELSVVVLLQKLQPLFAITLSIVLLKERITFRFVLLAIIALCGAFFVTFPDPLSSLSLTGTLPAALLAIAAAFAWGTSTVGGKIALQSHPFHFVTAMRLLTTAVIGALSLLFVGKAGTVVSLSSNQWLMLLAIVLSTGSVALGLYYFGLRHVPASRATIYELAWPLSALVIDWFVRGETLTLSQYFGAAILLAAITQLPRDSFDEIVVEHE